MASDTDPVATMRSRIKQLESFVQEIANLPHTSNTHKYCFRCRAQNLLSHIYMNRENSETTHNRSFDLLSQIGVGSLPQSEQNDDTEPQRPLLARPEESQYK